jgi:hypothetical protein
MGTAATRLGFVPVIFCCRGGLDPATRTLFEHALEAARRRYCFRIIGYGVMPEHLHPAMRGD